MSIAQFEAGGVGAEGRSEAHAAIAVCTFLLVVFGRLPGVTVTPWSFRQLAYAAKAVLFPPPR
jgi:hypothetical protein